MARKIARSPSRARQGSARKPASSGGASSASRVRTRTKEEQMGETLFLGAVLVALVFFIYSPVFNAGFIWDDDQLLTSNLQVHSPKGWWTLFLKPDTADYFPLTSITLWLEYQLGQFAWPLQAIWNVPFLQQNPGSLSGYHITNVVFHAITVVLTWQALRRLKVPGAWVAAAIFAAHPVCVESVAWISERKNTISQIFFLLSIIYYVRFQENRSGWRYVAAVACFTFSLLAKTSVVMLPFILLILSWWRRKEIEPMRDTYQLEENAVERDTVVWTGAAAGLAAAGAAILMLRLRTGMLHENAVEAAIGNPVFGPLQAVAVYAGNSFMGIDWLRLFAEVAAMGVCGTIGYFAGLQIKKLKIWNSFAGFEAVRTLPFFLSAFVLGLVTIYFQYGRAIGGEEIPLGSLWQRAASACFATGFYIYSAVWPFYIMEIYPQWHRAFSLLITLPHPHMDPPAPEALPYWAQVIPGLLIAGLAAWCWMKRAESWARAMLVGLSCYILAMLPALGMLKMSYMRLTLVADHFQYISIVALIALIVAAGATRNLRPIWLGVAAVFFAVCAWMHWDRTEENHGFEIIWILATLTLLAGVLVRDRWKEIWACFVAVLLLCFTIQSYQQSKIYLGEKTLWSATLEKNPFSWQAHNHLGAALYMEGNWRAAGPHFLRATQLKPENPESHNNLGLYYSLAKEMDKAIEQYKTAVNIKDDSSMETNLANALSQVARFEEAVHVYEHAIELSPRNASAHCNLGYVYLQLGKVDDAIPHFIKTIEIDPRMPQGRTDLFQSLRMKGIDLEHPDLSGSYSFDLRKAVDLLQKYPPDQPPPPR